MNYKKLGGRKMRGFMCQPEVATEAMCMSCDSRSSVVVPAARRRILVEEHTKLINKNYSKYTRLGDVPRGLGAMPIIATTNNNTITRRSRNGAATGSAIPVLKISKKDQENGSQIVSSLPSSDIAFQVVVMRVSLHCQGCAGKVKKHLSKMEGVTSFSIELDTKRVTVMGHVSPVGVLESISKVKRAEFWP